MTIGSTRIILKCSTILFGRRQCNRSCGRKAFSLGYLDCVKNSYLGSVFAYQSKELC
ncbi:hypothetical protein NC651_014097 [Populus alba x Populus x berolinensis]|nr:hypothetical protein NC651_014097 [Populus alba x Populus x berolinensis]